MIYFNIAEMTRIDILKEDFNDVFEHLLTMSNLITKLGGDNQDREYYDIKRIVEKSIERAKYINDRLQSSKSIDDLDKVYERKDDFEYMLRMYVRTLEFLYNEVQKMAPGNGVLLYYRAAIEHLINR